MAIRKLDVGNIEGAQQFDTAKPYQDGTPRYAARSSWFIKFWGYVFHKLPDSIIPNQPENTAILFVGTDGILKIKNGSTVKSVVQDVDLDSLGLQLKLPFILAGGQKRNVELISGKFVEFRNQHGTVYNVPLEIE